jgi:hypothetical protein
MNPAIAAIAALVSLSLVLASCKPGAWGILSPLKVQELRVSLPEAPASWDGLPDLRMSLAWRDPEGRLRNEDAASGSSVRIEVERGRPQAIIAIPSSSGRALMPAGALYPEALAEAGGEGGASELGLDWRGGYAASLAIELEKGGIDASGYDLYALVDKAIARAEDPWLVPPLEAARRLAEGGFRIDLYRKPKRFGLELPGPGPWVPESPFAPLPSGADGRGLSASLPEGLWRYVGCGEELFVSVDEKGAAAFALR